MEFDRGESEIFENGEIVDEIEMLENHADVLAHGDNVVFCDELAVVINFSARRLFEAVNKAKESGFSTTRRPKNGDTFAFF